MLSRNICISVITMTNTRYVQSTIIQISNSNLCYPAFLWHFKLRNVYFPHSEDNYLLKETKQILLFTIVRNRNNINLFDRVRISGGWAYDVPAMSESGSEIEKYCFYFHSVSMGIQWHVILTLYLPKVEDNIRKFWINMCLFVFHMPGNWVS